MNLSQHIFLFNKPYRWTSFDVVRKVKGSIIGSLKKAAIDPSQRINLKVGHAGTLDPLATGLLVVCTGSNTKKIQEIQDAEKEYTGTFYLGATTISHDLESEVIKLKDVDSLDEKLLQKTILSFLGKHEQTPPAFSAVKVEGKRAYTLARKGQKPEIKAKVIEIKEFEISKIQLPELHFRVVCSKGTYIRVLAHEFGEKLGTGAYLSSLCRTRIGSYKLADAIDPMEFSMQLADKQAN
ncbi:MAG: tRNA pseudouridine(55) synthase TruB [Bacteroidetes bacterium]|nr:MAG: tRNA pseudouridine(55) synthase TruB [Bacteroidota bacterium]